MIILNIIAFIIIPFIVIPILSLSIIILEVEYDDTDKSFTTLCIFSILLYVLYILHL